MNLLLDRLMFWLLNRYSPKVYNNIDEVKRDQWLMSLMISDGFKHYFTYRDLQILKTIGGGLSQEDYWRLVGQRLELLHLIGESKRIYERRKKERSGGERNSEYVESI